VSGPPRKPHGLRPEPSYRREPLGNPLSPTQTLARAREDQPIPFGRQPHRPPSIPTIAPSRRIARSSASFGLLRGAPARPGPGGFPPAGGMGPRGASGSLASKTFRLFKSMRESRGCSGLSVRPDAQPLGPRPVLFQWLREASARVSVRAGSRWKRLRNGPQVVEKGRPGRRQRGKIERATG